MTTKSQSAGFSFWRLVFTSITLWVGGIFLIVGVLLTVTGIQSASTETAYRKEGLTADAKVLDKLLERAKRGENSRTRYLVSYRFRSEQGKEMDGVTEVPVEEWEALEAGSSIRVLYLPDSPGTNRVEGENEWIVSLVFIYGWRYTFRTYWRKAGLYRVYLNSPDRPRVKTWFPDTGNGCPGGTVPYHH